MIMRLRPLALLALLLLPGLFAGAARAGERSLTAGFQIGEEVRYTLTVTSDETTSVTGSTGIGAHATSTETVGVLIRCKARTVPLTILEVVYESFRYTLDSPAGKVEIDLGGPVPDERSPQLARDLYAALHGIVGTTLTLNTAPGSGTITTFRGGEALRTSTGASILRRYLDRDLFEATFAPILQLKENGASPPPGQKWYVQRNLFAYAHPGKVPIWETRVLDGVLADIATVKGTTAATAEDKTGGKAPATFTNISGDVTYTWDLIRGRLTNATRTELMKSRFTSNSVMKDSDLISRSMLTLVQKKQAAEAPVAPPVTPPAPNSAPTPTTPPPSPPQTP